MKSVSVIQLSSEIDDIVKEAETDAKNKGQQFVGLTYFELSNRLRERIGESWSIKNNPPQFDINDMRAVANSRYFNRAGGRWLAILMAILAAMFLLTRFVPNYEFLFMTIVGVTAAIILFIYTKELKKVRSELIESVFGDKKK